jgi:predicted permease
VSFVEVPDNVVLATFYQFLDALKGALMLVVALTIGLMLRPISIRRLGVALAAVAAIKLIVDPWIAAELARLDALGHLKLEVLLIEAAMPSGTIAAVLAARYGCDGSFASALVVLTYSLSLITTPLAVYLLV